MMLAPFLPHRHLTLVLPPNSAVFIAWTLSAMPSTCTVRFHCSASWRAAMGPRAVPAKAPPSSTREAPAHEASGAGEPSAITMRPTPTSGVVTHHSIPHNEYRCLSGGRQEVSPNVGRGTSTRRGFGCAPKGRHADLRWLRPP